MREPKVLLFDIETYPNLGYTWGKYEQNVLKFTKYWELASVAYKWLGDRTVQCFSRKTHSERELVKKTYDLVNDADILIAHNGDNFDIKKVKTKFLKFGFSPSALTRSVDTRKIARSQFGFASNSLNDLAEELGFGKKLNTGGFDLWLDCMAGDKKALTHLEVYNKQDVVLLEKIYLKFRAWAPNHPSLAVLSDVKGCPKCGSQNIQSRGFTVAVKQRKSRYQCQDCGGWFT